jgi:hypothetical protein
MKTNNNNNTHIDNIKKQIQSLKTQFTYSSNKKTKEWFLWCTKRESNSTVISKQQETPSKNKINELIRLTCTKLLEKCGK